MEEFAYNIAGVFIYIYGWVPFSGYAGFYQLDNWHQKWGQKISKRGYY